MFLNTISYIRDIYKIYDTNYEKRISMYKNVKTNIREYVGQSLVGYYISIRLSIIWVIKLPFEKKKRVDLRFVNEENDHQSFGYNRHL